MKILQINVVCGYGSTGRIATDIYKLLEAEGHECLIAFGRGTAPEGINSYRIGTNYDNYAHVIKSRLLDQHGFASRNATMEFIKKAKEYDPDIIHLHNIHGYYLNVELLFEYLKEINKPVIWTLHDCWAFTGHCAHFDFVGCNKWVNGCNNCPQISSYPKSLLIDNSKANYKNKKNIFCDVKNMSIITPSKWLAELVKNSFLKEYPVQVINNGIDLKAFQYADSDFRQNNNLQDKYLILGVASIWTERKGLDAFLALSKIMNDNEIIVLVGVTAKQKSMLPANIIGITRTDSLKELAEIYSTADIFLNPTLEDNFPTTNLEALACGTPVITFATGGSVESIDNTCGAIIENTNVDDLYETILHLKTNRLIKEDIIRKSKQYDKNNCYLEYINLYSNAKK